MKPRGVNLLTSFIIIITTTTTATVHCLSYDDKVVEKFCNCWFWDHIRHNGTETEIALAFEECPDPRKLNRRPNTNANMIFDIILFRNSDGQSMDEKSIECNIFQKRCVRSVLLTVIPNVDYSVEISPYCGSRCFACSPLIMDYNIPVVETSTILLKTTTTTTAPHNAPDTALPIAVISVVSVIILISAVLLVINKYKYRMKLQGSQPLTEIHVTLNNKQQLNTDNYNRIVNTVFVASQPLLSANKADDHKNMKFIHFLESFSELRIKYLTCLDLNILETITSNFQECDTVVLVLTSKLVHLSRTEDLYSREMRYMLKQTQGHFLNHKDLYVVNIEDSNHHIETLKKNKFLETVQVIFRIQEITETDEQLQLLINCLLSKINRNNIT